jgi:hypothetical protein
MDLLEKRLGYRLLVRGLFNKFDVRVRTIPSRTDFPPEVERRIAESKIEVYHDLARLVEWRIIRNEGLELVLGRTNYREYVVTRDVGIVDQNHWNRISNPLALCSMILTSDERLVMIVRSSRVEAYPGRLHAPASGFIKLPRDEDSEHIPDPFLGLQNEARQELGGTMKLSGITCTGLAYDVNLAHPELLFQATTELSYGQILEMCADGSSYEGSEIASLLEVSPDERSLTRLLLDNVARFVPTGFACAARWAENRFGRYWFSLLCRSLVSS